MATRPQFEQLESRSVPAVLGYSVDSDGEGEGSDSLYQIDLETGDATPIGAVGFPSVEGLAFQPGTNVLFGVDDQLDQLITIDLTTGAGTLVGDLGLDVNDVGLAFDSDGNLWLSTDIEQNLYSVDPATGAAALIGPLGQPVTGLAFRDGVLYGLGGDDFSPTFDNLVQVDRATGAATPIGALGQIFVDDGGLDFDETGVLWGLKDSGEGDLTFTIDPATGAGTAVAHTQFGFEGLAIIVPPLDAPPEPPPVDPPAPPPEVPLPPAPEAEADPCEGSIAGVGIVEALYCKILHREADHAGLDGYNSRLANGESVESIAAEIWNSAEHRRSQVEEYFATLFGVSLPPEVVAEQAEVLSDLGELEYLARVLGSPDFRALYPGDADWLAVVYNLVLGRAPDSAAEVYLPQAAASRTDVARAILSSDEAELFVVLG